MEFLCVGQTKLKVVLSKAECDAYNIKSIDSETKDKAPRQSLRRILDLAQEASSFRVTNERLLVQVYPLSDGGCELFITKLSAISERERRAVKASDELLTVGSRVSVYRFSSLTELTLASRAVQDKTIPCDVYRADNGEYYISVTETAMSGISDCEVLSEFGERIRSLPISVRGERGQLIVRDTGFLVFSRL